MSNGRYNEKIADISGEIADIWRIADIIRLVLDGVCEKEVAVRATSFYRDAGYANQHKKAGRVSSSLRVTFNLTTAIFFSVL